SKRVKNSLTTTTSSMAMKMPPACAVPAAAGAACIQPSICARWRGSAPKPQPRQMFQQRMSLRRMLQFQLPEQVSPGAAALDRLGSHLESIVAKALHRAPAPESPLLAWPVTCGSTVAERTRAVSFASGVLLVEVSDAGWRQELSALAPRYLATINKYSAAQVRRIEFVV